MTSESSAPGSTHEVLTVEQAAELLQLHIETVRKLVRDKKIPSRKVGGSYRISRRQLLEWIEAGDPAAPDGDE